MKKSTRIGAIAALTLAATVAVGAPAMAASAVVTAAPGTTVTLETYLTRVGTDSNITSGNVVFKAPTGTTFPAQSSVAVDFSSDSGATFENGNLSLTGCTVNTGSTELSCKLVPLSGTSAPWNTGTIWRAKPVVDVNATATAGTFSTSNYIVWNPVGSGSNWNNTNGTLAIQIAEALPIPVVAPLIAGGAGVAALAGALIVRRRKNAQASA